MKKKEPSMAVVSSSDELYDDCPICQAMKKAEEEGRNLNMEELTEVFEMANATLKSKESKENN